MSANGATKRDLFRVIREKDAEIAKLYERIWKLEEVLALANKANESLLIEEGYIT